MFSAMHYGKISAKVQPFGGLMAGVGFVNLKNPDNQISQFTPKAAWGLRGGLNLSSASSLKLRIYSNLLWTMKGIGGNFASNTSGNTITSGRPATMIQMQTGASVYFTFHKKEKKPGKNRRKKMLHFLTKVRCKLDLFVQYNTNYKKVKFKNKQKELCCVMA